MAVEFCSTAAEEVVLTADQNPAAVNITVPADCTAVYFVWVYNEWFVGGGALATATLNGSAPDEQYELPHAVTYKPATGVAAWYSPPTGVRSLDIAWDQDPVEGPVCAVVYLKGGVLSLAAYAYAHDEVGNAVSATLTGIAAGNLCVKFDQKVSTPPSLSSGWTNVLTTSFNGEAARLSYITATGTSQVCDSEDEDYSALVAFAVASLAGGGGGQAPRSMHQHRMRRAA